MRKFSAAILAWFVLGACDAQAQTVLRLMEKATVVGPRIQLGEIVEMPNTGKGYQEKLKGLEVGRAAPPEKSVVLTRMGIILTLRREGPYRTVP